jgi:site-specific DNA-methyltransferase (adenine-specific)
MEEGDLDDSEVGGPSEEDLQRAAEQARHDGFDDFDDFDDFEDDASEEGPQVFLDGRVALHAGDCREVLKTLPDNSIDSVVTDPPYHLQSVVKRFGGKNAAPAKEGSDGLFQRSSKGFMGKDWDGGDIAFQTDLWAEVLRVLKPGGYIFAFSSSRTYHRMAVAIEDAGFITHPMHAWVFGQGLPKAHSVAIDREKTLCTTIQKDEKTVWIYCEDGVEMAREPPFRHEDANKWFGWEYGTQSTKPALEPIYFGQKPFSEKNGTLNILKWGTGAVNIEACKIHSDDAPGGEYTVKRLKPGATLEKTGGNWRPEEGGVEFHGKTTPGRWPAQILHDGSDEVVAAFPNSAGQLADVSTNEGSKTGRVYGKMNREGEATADKRYTDAGSTNFAMKPGMRRNDSGSAARFFYSAKASKRDRVPGSKHPTVKPISLLQWLVRLITPPGGTTLDLFAGTGTTAEAAHLEGFKSVLIEREEDYLRDIATRLTTLDSRGS